MRRFHRNILWSGLVAAALIGAAFAGWSLLRPARTTAVPAETLARGQELYAANCAACHGAQLEGQPDWRSPLASGRLPAPPHDASGHTWHHADDLLFRITREGTAAIVGGGYESDMPGFSDVLSDDEIRAILAYIKSTWPERQQRHQERLSQPN